MHSSRMRTDRSLPYGGSLPDIDPWTETPLDRDPPGQRTPLTETPLTETPTRQRTSWTETGHVTCDACWDTDPPCEQNHRQV